MGVADPYMEIVYPYIDISFLAIIEGFVGDVPNKVNTSGKLP